MAKYKFKVGDRVEFNEFAYNGIVLRGTVRYVNDPAGFYSVERDDRRQDIGGGKPYQDRKTWALALDNESMKLLDEDDVPDDQVHFGGPWHVGDRIEFLSEEYGDEGSRITGTITYVDNYDGEDEVELGVRRDDGKSGGGKDGTWAVRERWNSPMYLLNRKGEDKHDDLDAKVYKRKVAILQAEREAFLKREKSLMKMLDESFHRQDELLKIIERLEKEATE